MGLIPLFALPSARTRDYATVHPPISHSYPGCPDNYIIYRDLAYKKGGILYYKDA